MDPIQMYTDLTYGFLLLVGLVSMHLFPGQQIMVGFGVGLFVGYAVHVGSKMVKYHDMRSDVEDAAAKAERAAEKSSEAVEKTEKTTETVEQTKEVVENVEKKTEEVADDVGKAVNGE